jgi:hypothetical protein
MFLPLSYDSIVPTTKLRLKIVSVKDHYHAIRKKYPQIYSKIDRLRVATIIIENAAGITYLAPAAFLS